jgi:enoyl-CoA hydratase/carnithine racemase
MAELEYEVENGVGTILLNRPEKKNAFNLEMLHRWDEALREARTDDSVGAIVLTGAGDAFCAGSDFEGLSPDAEGEPTPYDRKAFLTEHVH